MKLQKNIPTINHIPQEKERIENKRKEKHLNESQHNPNLRH